MVKHDLVSCQTCQLQSTFGYVATITDNVIYLTPTGSKNVRLLLLSRHGSITAYFPIAVKPFIALK